MENQRQWQGYTRQRQIVGPRAETHNQGQGGERQVCLQKEGGACGPELSGRGTGGQEEGGHGGQCLKQWCARADIHGLRELTVKCQ